jgi:hypothetical protein
MIKIIEMVFVNNICFLFLLITYDYSLMCENSLGSL